MLYKLNNLEEDERQELIDAIPVITLLIAGADGEISVEELNESKKITRIRGFSGGEHMQAFYDKVGEDYAERLARWMKVISKDTAERIADLSARLEKLNPILAKLDQETAHHFYKSFTSFAMHVAKADGGIQWLKLGTVNSDEAKLVNLPMLTPIALPEEDSNEA